MDVYAVTRAEGVKTRKTLNKLEDTTRSQPAEREHLLWETRARIEGRHRLKEVLLYPLLEFEPHTTDAVRASRRRDAEVSGLLEELSQTSLEDARFQPRCEALSSMLHMHIEEDEYELLRRAAEVIPEEQAEELGERAEQEVTRLEQRLA